MQPLPEERERRFEAFQNLIGHFFAFPCTVVSVEAFPGGDCEVVEEHRRRRNAKPLKRKAIVLDTLAERYEVGAGWGI